GRRSLAWMWTRGWGPASRVSGLGSGPSSSGRSTTGTRTRRTMATSRFSSTWDGQGWPCTASSWPGDTATSPVPCAGILGKVVSDGLRRLAVRGAGVTVLSNGLGFALQMIGTVVLARLLTPADYGLVTMVTIFSLIPMNCGLNGFTEAVLQREEVDHTLASNLFWINVGLSLLLTIGFAAAGPLLGWFYGDPRVAAVAVAVALTIFFTSLSVLHLALLKRAMRFTGASANDIVARAVSVT